MPPINAAPYPFSFTTTTRAPSSVAIEVDPSVDPLSATITSPMIPWLRSVSTAFRTQLAIVSASLRQGITTEISISAPRGARSGSVSRIALVTQVTRGMEWHLDDDLGSRRGTSGVCHDDQLLVSVHNPHAGGELPTAREGLRETSAPTTLEQSLRCRTAFADGDYVGVAPSARVYSAGGVYGLRCTRP